MGTSQPPPAPGLGLAGGPPLGSTFASARLASASAANFSAMQPAGACNQPSSYNPSGEILAMINKGQGLGLAPSKGLGLTGGLPQGLGQQQVGASGLGQVPQQHPQGMGMGGMPGMPQPDHNVGMGGGGFDSSDFPSLGHRANVGNAGLQQFRNPGHSPLGPPQSSEFAIVSEEFPALPGAAPSNASIQSSAAGGGGSCCGGVGVCGGGNGIFRGGAMDSGVEAVLSMKEAGAAAGGAGCGLRGAAEEMMGSHCGSVGGMGGHASVARADRFGLMGILSVIRMTDQDLNTLALGTDLTTLGLNLNSSDCLYATFASPWADSPAQRDPEFTLPQCYYMQPAALKTSHFSKLQLETLFYIFYNMPRDTLQAYAVCELYNRDWRYHKDLTLWFTRASRHGAHGTEDTSKGQYIYFDINEWKKKMFYGAGQNVPSTSTNDADADGDVDAMPPMVQDGSQ